MGSDRREIECESYEMIDTKLNLSDNLEVVLRGGTNWTVVVDLQVLRETRDTCSRANA